VAVDALKINDAHLDETQLEIKRVDGKELRISPPKKKKKHRNALH